MSDEKIKPSIIPNTSLSPKQDKVTFTPRNIVTLFIVYELNTRSKDLNADFTLQDCLFESVNLTKLPNFDLSKNTIILK